ncbi:MAG: aminotransferase, partial [Planctomycetes bacterium]|nr:aminotransferase [Planctomycetota bacterium]
MREPGPSRRAREITAFQVMEIMEAAKRLEAAGASVIHLEVGEPDFPTPACVLKAARKAMR